MGQTSRGVDLKRGGPKHWWTSRGTDLKSDTDLKCDGPSKGWPQFGHISSEMDFQWEEFSVVRIFPVKKAQYKNRYTKRI